MSAVAARRPIYIVGPLYDWALFLLPPILSLLAGAAISGTYLADHVFWLAGRRVTPSALAVGVLTSAHLVAVAFRSHANPAVRARHPFRFLVLPALAFGAMMTSVWAVCLATV